MDTKYEFGAVGDSLYVIDEMHTPDSSRFWRASSYEERLASGDDQVMLDKENVRQWLIREKGFSGHGPLPVIPEDVRVKTAELYLGAYAEITGTALKPAPVTPRSASRRTYRCTATCEHFCIGADTGHSSTGAGETDPPFPDTFRQDERSPSKSTPRNSGL